MQAQRFVNIVLLPHVRRDIRDNRRLHFALFQSLKKACYKPDAFYKVLFAPAASLCTLQLHASILVFMHPALGTASRTEQQPHDRVHWVLARARQTPHLLPSCPLVAC